MHEATASPQSPYVRGFHIAVEGMKTALKTPDVGRAYLKVAAVIFVLSLALGAGLIWALWANTAPAEDAAMWLVVTLWIARVVGSLVSAALGPLLAIFVVNIAFPFFNNPVFNAALKAVDPERAALLAGRPGMPVMTALLIAVWRLVKFLFFAVVLFFVGLIPVVGTILATVAGLFLAARTISWELLDPYFDALDIRYAEQKQIVARHQKALIGFGVPIALLMAIPVLGPLLFGLAQAAGAAFVARELPIDVREQTPPLVTTK